MGGVVVRSISVELLLWWSESESESESKSGAN